MKTTAKVFISLLLLLICMPLTTSAQIDEFGATDTVWAEISRIDNLNWSINISYFNDEPVVGMSIPLKLSAGLNKVVADSCIYTGGRVENFAIRAFRADTTIQCVTLGMIASMTSMKSSLQPGKGRLATIFVSSLMDEPFDQLKVDTTTTHPNNSLEVIADSVQGMKGDTVKITDMTKRRIVPVFITKYSE